MWIITEDLLAKPGEPEGTNQNAKGMASCNYRKEASLPYRFRMLDDDGEIYYLGYCSREIFAPLDDFGAPNAGCTSIEYWNEEEQQWKQL